MSKKQIYIVFILIFVCIFPFQVSANGPSPQTHVLCRIENKPENAAHVDLLIQINKSDREYVAYNTANGESLGIPEQSQIVSYNQDGFASFTFHFANAEIENDSYWTIDRWFAKERTQYKILEEKYHVMKVALIDKDGGILQISESVDINPLDRPGFFTGSITYDAAANTIDASYYDAPLGRIVGTSSGFFAAVFSTIFTFWSIKFRALISSGIETLIAIPFKIPSRERVFGVNILTQIFLNIFMAVCGLPYFWCLLIGEVIVYIAEFLIFKRIYKDIPVRRLAIFVVTANTASLIAGMWINSF